MGDSTVKVGIRIRPLLSKEKERNQNALNITHDQQSIIFKNQTFTFDHVFGAELSQQELYQHTAAPMLKSFLEGFNVTILAYGQTGSGKTFTMGSSGANLDCQDNQGLIPRFVSDLFENLDQSIDAKVRVSFLEIYGEDIYDLLSSSSRGMERPSLPVRENDQGLVFVQGQQELEVQSAMEALEYLYSGSKNRLTASTNMNSTSSRSHAVFTVTIDQKIQSSAGDDPHSISSKLTFVDLAGSERIKRTGADGQRMKEGIQINSGLFNLGQVINGLADDQKLKNGQAKTAFVPYRNSKLTHLLKDALGGNSQTLFLACVSPAEDNENETYTTLTYARQARNIQNKPVRNMDQTQLELRKLKMANNIWMMRALTLAFSNTVTNNLCLEDTSYTKPPSYSCPIYEDPEELMTRPDVMDYIATVNKSINDRVNGSGPTPRKVRISVAPSPFKRRGQIRHSPSKTSSDTSSDRNSDPESIASAAAEFRKWSALDGNEVGFGTDTDDLGSSLAVTGMSRRESCLLEELDPEESRAMVEALLEMEKKGKEASLKEAATAEEVANIETEIGMKEEILTKLLDVVKEFGPMKQEYERLLSEITKLDAEKHTLECELEKAKKGNNNPQMVSDLKDKVTKVTSELDRMRTDRHQKEAKMKFYARNNQHVDTLQKELKKLKDAKVALMKDQKAQAQKLANLRKEQLKKDSQLKRQDVKKQQEMNSLKSEVAKKDRLLALKNKEIDRIHIKNKAYENHIQSLLKTHSNSTKNRIRTNAINGGKDDSSKQKHGMSAEDHQMYLSTKKVLLTMMEDQVDERFARSTLSLKSQELKDLNDELSDEVQELESLQTKLMSLEKERDKELSSSTNNPNGIQESDNDEEYNQIMQAIKETQVTMEKISHEMDLVESDIQVMQENIERVNRSDNLSQKIVSDSISALAISPCKELLGDMINEAIEALDALRKTQSELNRVTGTAEEQKLKIEELQVQLKEIRREMSMRLNAAEKQRVNDVWDILQGSESSVGNGNNIGQEVIMLRARELENELEIYVVSEGKLKEEIIELKAQCSRLERKVQSQEVRARLEALSNMDAMIGTGIVAPTSTSTSTSALAGNFPNVSIQMRQVEELWDLLGQKQSDRLQAVKGLEELTLNAKDELLQDTQIAVAMAEQQIIQAKKDIITCCQVLRKEISDYINPEESNVVELLPKSKIFQSALSTVTNELQTRQKDFYSLKDRLLSLLMDMDIEVTELSGCLKSVMSIEFPNEEDSVQNSVVNFALNLQSHQIFLHPKDIDVMNDALRQLNATRVTNVSRSLTVRLEVVQLVELLGINSMESLSELGNCDNNVSAQNAMRIATGLALTTTVGNPPGSQSVLTALEKLKFGLKSALVNRESASALTRELIGLSDSCLGTNILDALQSAVPHEAESLNKMLSIINTLSNTAKVIGNECRGKLLELLRESMTWISNMEAGNCDPEIAISILSTMSAMEGVGDICDEPFLGASRLTAIVNEMSELAAFSDETWLAMGLQAVKNEWGETFREIRQAVIFRNEMQRIQSQCDLVNDLRKYDELLSKHVADMEAFEATSKLDRMKVLNGNSKALVEEEKFRKNGKRKYEQLADKITAAFGHLQAVMVLGDHVDILSLGLGPKSQELLAAGQKMTRMELMHLDTATLGTRRWSGDKNALAGVINQTSSGDADESDDGSVKSASNSKDRDRSPGRQIVKSNIATVSSVTATAPHHRSRPSSIRANPQMIASVLSSNATSKSRPLTSSSTPTVSGSGSASTKATPTGSAKGSATSIFTSMSGSSGVSTPNSTFGTGTAKRNITVSQTKLKLEKTFEKLEKVLKDENNNVFQKVLMDENNDVFPPLPQEEKL